MLRILLLIGFLDNSVEILLMNQSESQIQSRLIRTRSYLILTQSFLILNSTQNWFLIENPLFGNLSVLIQNNYLVLKHP